MVSTPDWILVWMGKKTIKGIVGATGEMLVRSHSHVEFPGSGHGNVLVLRRYIHVYLGRRVLTSATNLQ